MSKTLKKTLSIIVAILMIVTSVPFAFAAEGETRTIYVHWDFGRHAGNFQKMFFDSMGNELPYEFESIEDNFDLYRISVDAASYWFDFSNNGTHEGAIPEKVDYYEAATQTWYCSHQLGTSFVENDGIYECEICGEKKRIIYIAEDGGNNVAGEAFDVYLKDANGNDVSLISVDTITNNALHKYEIPTIATLMCVEIGGGFGYGGSSGVGGGGDNYDNRTFMPIPSDCDTYHYDDKVWYCSHNMNTSGKQTCKGFLCEICGETYGEADPNAHDWSKLDGICANGCGAVCDHAGQTGVCTICGKNNAVAMLTLEGAQPEYFSTFEDAIDEARRSENEGALVTVLQDINFGGYGANDFAYIEGGSFTIDLNGKKLNSPALVFSLYKSEIDFIDSVGTAVVDGGEGYAIDAYNANANIYGGTYKGFCGIGAEAGTVIIDGANVKIENYNNWDYSGSAAIKATENGTITVKNSVISTAAEQTILCYDGSVINIEGGTISGSIYYVGGDVCLSGGTFLDGFAVDGGRINELSEFVKDGYAFYNSDGEVVSSSVKALSKACTVKEHTHSFTDSSCPCGYACFHPGQTGNTCEYCGTTLHTCDFTGEWKYDSEKHWKECTCGAKEQIASHEDTLVQAEAKAPTCSAAGYEAYEYCTTCDYTTYEELPKEIFHKDADKNNKCDDCSAELAFEINRNGELLYYDNPYIQGFQALYDAAQDGDVITLLRNVFAYTIEIRKELTYDLNGFNIITASSRSIKIYDNVTIRDSVGGGEIHLAVYIGAPCTIEGGMFYSLGVASGITLDSILSPCAGYYDYKGNAIDTTGKTSIDNAYVIKNHTEGDIYNCLGYKCAVCEKYYGEPNPDGHAYTEGVCDLCGYECPHEETYYDIIRPVQNADGTWGKGTAQLICVVCGPLTPVEEVERNHEGYKLFDETAAKLELLLARDDIIPTPKASMSNSLRGNRNAAYSRVYTDLDFEKEMLASMTKNVNDMLVELEARIADGMYIKADFSYLVSLLNEINALVDNNPENIISSFSVIYADAVNFYKNNSNNPGYNQNAYDYYVNSSDLENQLEKLIAGLKDGSAVKADYTAIDEAIEELDEKLSDVNLTEEAKAGLEEIKAQLEEMKKDPSASKADVDELMDAVEELDEAIEDGSAVKVNGISEINKYTTSIEKEIIEKYGVEEYQRISNSLSDDIKAEIMDIINEAEGIEGSLKDNEEKLNELKARVDVIYAKVENCLNGTHNGLDYVVTEEAKCEANAIESATCTLCGEVLTREVENSALTHSFTNYEVVEESACEKAGKKVAYCDHGCGKADEKEIPALEHIFLEYKSNGDATCEADGTKTAECVLGCGATDTVTDKGSKLDHTDEDGDKACDDCEEVIKDVCPDCGGDVHEGPYGEYICALRILIRLFVTLVKLFVVA